jgi:hypothetical protein
MIPEQDKNTIQEVADRYISRGWSVLPLTPRGKDCPIKGWQNRRIKSGEIEEYFLPNSNIGILLGEPSGGLIDVDLDCPEAVMMAKHFFRDTLEAGRGGNRTHLFYKVSEGIKSFEYKDLEKGDGNILEIRSDRKQTVVYPSIHPSGEQYEWMNTLEPREVSKIDLRSMAARAATAALLLKYLPNEGEGLHDISLAFVGFMGRNLLDAAEDPEEVIELLWSVLEPLWIANLYEVMTCRSMTDHAGQEANRASQRSTRSSSLET